MKAKELGRILLAMGDISVVFASSCNDKQIQLQDVKGIKLENNIVTDSYDLLCIDNLYEVVYIEEEGTFAFKSLDKVDNYEPFVNLLEAYVVGNKFDKEK